MACLFEFVIFAAMRIRLLITAGILFFGFSSAYAQFNDSVHHYLNINVSGTLNRSPTAKAYLFNNWVKYSLNKSKTQLNFNNGWVYGLNTGVLTNNDYTSTLDFNVFKSKEAKLNYWGLAGYTSSFSLKINHQLQTGLGAAYKFVDKPYMYLRVSDGLIYENSTVLLQDTLKENYSTIRNSLRVQLRLYYNKMISFEGVSFWQPSLQHKNDYIFTSQVGLNVKLVKWLSLTTRFNYNKMSRTQKENILFTYGVLIEQYF